MRSDAGPLPSPPRARMLPSCWTGRGTRERGFVARGGGSGGHDRTGLRGLRGGRPGDRGHYPRDLRSSGRLRNAFGGALGAQRVALPSLHPRGSFRLRSLSLPRSPRWRLVTPLPTRRSAATSEHAPTIGLLWPSSLSWLASCARRSGPGATAFRAALAQARAAKPQAHGDGRAAAARP